MVARRSCSGDSSLALPARRSSMQVWLKCRPWHLSLGMLFQEKKIASQKIWILIHNFRGQYHWVSEFSPPKYQKVLSYYSGKRGAKVGMASKSISTLMIVCIGWLTAVGWQVYLASVCFLVGTMIQGLIALNDPEYSYLRWHGTLLAIAIIVFTISFNTIFASRLPLVGK